MSVSKKLNTVVLASAFATLFVSGISTAAPHPAGGGIDYTQVPHPLNAKVELWEGIEQATSQAGERVDSNAFPHPLNTRFDYSERAGLELNGEVEIQSTVGDRNAPVPHPLNVRNANRG